MKNLVYIFLFFTFACSTKLQPQSFKKVGEIIFNPKLDNPNFELCNEKILEYFNVRSEKYIGEKIAIDNIFKNNYKNITVAESGLIRIRFIVNCKGKAGRFRVIQMNEDYKPFSFDKRVVNQLLTITKSIEKWVPKERKDKPIDYYQYLIFKIENGKLIEIMP